jgi:phosphatidylethanolamine/phosphatidyl-N-methylethanolamine N-methyltransferase
LVEFGPGTGRLTEAILNAGVRPADLTCLELDAQFAALIRRRFPGVTVITAGAETAALHVTVPAGAVISGLPLLSMPTSLRLSIIRAAFDILAPGGMMVQFTYGRNPPLSDSEFQTLGLRLEKGQLIRLNLPPARVYRFFRISD